MSLAEALVALESAMKWVVDAVKHIHPHSSSESATPNPSLLHVPASNAPPRSGATLPSSRAPVPLRRMPSRGSSAVHLDGFSDWLPLHASTSSLDASSGPVSSVPAQPASSNRFPVPKPQTIPSVSQPTAPLPKP